MKKILHIIPYTSLYPPKNGGQLRCFYLMQQMSSFFNVDVISYQSEQELKRLGYKNPNILFYSPEISKNKKNKIINALLYRWIRRSLKGHAHSVVLDFFPIIKKLAKKNKYDYVIYEHITSMLLSPIIKRMMPDAKMILDAHNIDYKLVKNENQKNIVKKIESQLYKQVDFFFACSKNDVTELENLNNNKIKGYNIPNGVNIEEATFCKNKVDLEKNILFCGTLDYYPNKEGLFWFFNKIWPEIKKNITNVTITIIGRGDLSPYKEYMEDPQINFVGEVDDVKPFYLKTYIAIVPLLSGSGTRLKILEAMSFGNPIITTTIGVEGIEVKQKKDIIIADDYKNFAKSVIEIIQYPSKGEEMRRNAYHLAKNKYDWNIIGQKTKKIL